jgi:hypothetical protein
MPNLGFDPMIRRMARDLGLPGARNCVEEITDHALRIVERVIQRSLFPVTDLESLKAILSSALSVTIRYVDTDSDIDQIASDFGNAHPCLASQLHSDFIDGDTEGLLLALPNPEVWQTRHLAVIDRRGDQVNRAYFTVWHELAHLLTTPEQLMLKELRRSPTMEAKAKDPIEQVTDHVAGLIAFYSPLFLPIFHREIGDSPLTFEAIERVRIAATPAASFQSTAMACVRASQHPTMFVKIEPGLTVRETREQRSLQFQMMLGAAVQAPTPKLRVAVCMKNAAAESTTLQIFKKMRVPANCVLTRVYDSSSEVEAAAREDQGWWETSTKGPLGRMALVVRGIRRGSHVYGLIAPVN